jgi:hypothetical protein
MQRYEWREYLDHLRNRGRPSDFKAFMDQIKDKPEIEAEIWAVMYGAVMVNDIGKTMLAAATQLPLEEAERALDEITRALQRSDFKAGLRRLPRRERRRYEQALRVIRRDVLPGSEALAVTFRHYIRDDYDLQQDPNLLIKEANGPGHGERREALELVGQAGALALRGRPLWSRWPEEVAQPLGSWVFILWTFIDYLRHHPDAYPLEEVEGERARWPATMVALERKQKPTEEPSPPERTAKYGFSLFDDLEPFLGGGEGITPPKLERLSKPKEEYVSLLLPNVERREAWDLDDWDDQAIMGNMILLLGSFKADEAVEPLIDVVAEGPPEGEDVLTQAAMIALGQMGEPAFRAAEDFIRYSDNQGAKVALAQVLAGRESEILRRPHGVIQDAQGYPLLVEFDEDDNPLCPHCGEPLVYVEGEGEAHEEPEEKPEPLRFPKVGRNDPCPCGSGKKYKHCHGKRR